MANHKEHRLLTSLRAGGRRDSRIAHVEVLPPRQATFAEWPSWANPAVVHAYRSLGIERPWAHQAQTANHAHAGRDTVIATSTASGKSLAFWLAGLTAIADHQSATRISDYTRRACVLYLSPTKALAADQSASLHRVIAATGLPIVAEACDGDTPLETRRYVQEHGSIVLTNPDMLHFSILPRHEYWARFLRGLAYVIIDECHAYRGVFGAHTALVLRRLTRIARHYGADPTFLLASATTGDPAASAARLIGTDRDIACVEQDSSPAGRRTVALWRPPEIDIAPPEKPQASAADDDRWSAAAPPADPWSGAAPPGDPWLSDAPVAQADLDEADDVTGVPVEVIRRSAAAECADLLADLVAASARTIAFVRSRFAAESVADATRRELHDVGFDLASKVASYRGGYLPEERRELERALRRGQLLGLVSTNALELGIDIAGLDAVLMAGWPGTRCSFWQQAGRAGRAGADGLAVWIAGNNPLDGYVTEHPEIVFGAPVEETVFDPSNRYVLAPHLCAAAAELPLRDDDERYFGPQMAPIADELADGGLLRRRPTGWYWTADGSAASLTDLRGIGGGQISIVEAGTGTVLGTVDQRRAESTTHPGAIYVHQGASYVVGDLDLEAQVALVEEKSPGYRTAANSTTAVAIVSTAERSEWTSKARSEWTSKARSESTSKARSESTSKARSEWGPIEWGVGEVDVTSQVVSYTKLRLPGLERMDTIPLDMPEHTMRTAACWWHLPAELLADVGIDTADVPGALHAAEHALIGMLPLLATCDRWDLGGLSTALHPQTERPTVFVHDALPGGTGFARRGFDARRRWVEATADVVSTCGCADGCPACVQSPKCGNGNHPLDKAGAAIVLRLLADSAPETS